MFYLQSSDTYFKNSTLKQLDLFDLNENKAFGTFIKSTQPLPPMVCEVRGTHCNSEAEWRALAKPYLDE